MLFENRDVAVEIYRGLDRFRVMLCNIPFCLDNCVFRSALPSSCALFIRRSSKAMDNFLFVSLASRSCLG